MSTNQPTYCRSETKTSGVRPSHLHHPPWSGWKNIDHLPRPLTNQVNVAMAHRPALKQNRWTPAIKWWAMKDGMILATWLTKSSTEWDFCCPEEIYLRICEDLSRPIGLHQTRYITLASDIDTFLAGFRWKSVGIRQVIRLLETFK